MRRRIPGIWLSIAAAMLAGCAARPRPEWATSAPTSINTSAEEARQRSDMDRAIATLSERPNGKTCDVLALSSGGQTGAFGAGLIEGWTTKGDRPEFGLVTGVSTGALIAVFAFLGPDGDATLREMYTTHGQSDVIDKRWWIELPLADSYARSTPLRNMINHYISDDVVRRIGGIKGRVLLVGTSNMDLCRLRVWNMTALAADEAIPLAARAARFRDIVMASMSIPMLMPPVFIDGHMHMDGGMVRQVFLTELDRADDLRRALGGHPRFWVIANRHVKTPPKVVANHMITISARSVQLMMDANLEKDLEEARRFAADCGGAFATAAVPPDLSDEGTSGMFDAQYMQRLHAEGIKTVLAGAAWGALVQGTSGGPGATTGP